MSKGYPPRGCRATTAPKEPDFIWLDELPAIFLLLVCLLVALFFPPI